MKIKNKKIIHVIKNRPMSTQKQNETQTGQRSQYLELKAMSEVDSKMLGSLSIIVHDENQHPAGLISELIPTHINPDTTVYVVAVGNDVSPYRSLNHLPIQFIQYDGFSPLCSFLTHRLPNHRGNMPQAILVLDACIDSQLLKSREVKTAIMSGRHYNIKCFLTCRSPKYLPKWVTANFSSLLICNPLENKEALIRTGAQEMVNQILSDNKTVDLRPSVIIISERLPVVLVRRS